MGISWIPTRTAVITDYTHALANITQHQIAATGGSSGHTPYDVAYLQIDDDGTVTVGVRTIYGGDATPEGIWHGRDRRYDLSGNPSLDDLRADLADGGRLSVLIDRAMAGNRVEHDGRNFVGHMTHDAREASADIAALLEDYPQSNLTAWDTEEWLYGSSGPQWALDCANLTVDATPEEIADAASWLADEATANRVVLTGASIDDVLRGAIAARRAEMVEDEQEDAA